METTTLAGTAELIRTRQVSPVEAAEAALRAIDAVDGGVRAFATVTADAALDAARAAERDVAAGRLRGPLHGVPIGVKDVFDTAGVPTTAGSRVLAGRVPARDADAVAALRAAGAVLVGKTHTVEFGVGVADLPTRNPWDLDRLPGGSSGGSAAAVAAGEVPMALGSDTGGSVRIPAALCGVTGLRPTAGRVPSRGLLPSSWSLDEPGPLARTALDVALAMDALTGGDGAFSTGIDRDVRGLTVGVPENLLPRVDGEVSAAFDAALAELASLGVRVKRVRLPLLEYGMAAYLPIALGEAGTLHADRLRESGDLYSEEVRTVLEAGRFVRLPDYLRAQRARTLHNTAWRDLFRDEGLDAVAAPGLPVTAPPADTASHRWPDGTEQNLAELCAPACVPATLTGLPALQVPCGFDRAGLPIGMQLTGRPLDEALLLRLAHGYQRATDWTAKTAPVRTR